MIYISCLPTRRDQDEKRSLMRRLAKAQMTKTGMMQQLLTSRTRLPIKDGAA